jgi:hemoglobin-like flavoprotein
MDTDLLKRTWEQVSRHGDLLPAYFYAHLFLTHPELRPMFKPGMAEQRDRLVTALGDVVSNVNNLDAVIPTLQHLGRDHARRHGVLPEHYPAVGAALLATLEHHLGDTWTPESAATWAEAYEVVASVMVAAAGEGESEQRFDQEVDQ